VGLASAQAVLTRILGEIWSRMDLVGAETSFAQALSLAFWEKMECAFV
jgi:hypothetical protein